MGPLPAPSAFAGFEPVLSKLPRHFLSGSRVVTQTNKTKNMTMQVKICKFLFNRVILNSYIESRFGNTDSYDRV